MKVIDLYTPLTVVAEPSEDLAEAARRMRRNDVGSLAVIDHGRLVGIVTERDITPAVADGVDQDARRAGIAMLGLGVRHLPVLSDDELVGVLSIRDVVQALVWSVEARIGQRC